MSLEPTVELFERTRQLVDIASVSHGEKEIADLVDSLLSEVSGDVLEIVRVGENVCARTRFGLPSRLVLAGHLDTVPANGNERAVVEGDLLSGLGSVDMKSGDAVFIELARAVALAGPEPRSAGLTTDLSFVFYACEEVDRAENGLLQVAKSAPSFLDGDAAVLGEPTAGLVEAGCQGVLRVVVEVSGTRAHTARPWMGENAIHRLAPILDAVAAFEPRTPVIDGCQFKEALQAVAVSGGVANNVVPDSARLVLNHRFAPDRSVEEAFAAISGLVSSAAGERDGSLSVVLDDSAEPAAPGLGHPLLSALVAATGKAPKAKLGWTDVSFFSSRGVPAANFGPGEPTLAHSAGEMVERGEIEQVFAALAAIVTD